ncbi:50S ribosomal protein L6 [Desulfohalobium retbaense]|uniref:Large ribosomal subunit protein uL6 n=1 Tax=Desulfohalobium retbaense (strain ATCC 49708 / DSM 5692 / JCM 16813 / HR100) TaxID=485915 RepID=C8X460_DESRD|nr:50S ribosomal protein L6 [Desulfohalobium retbaense]ACV69334.1 ribosomal protein L6 [Desulfohalobium retbaense DSM 5692]
MSRIGKLPVQIPQGVEVTLNKDSVDLKGPKGELQVPAHTKIRFAQEGDAILVNRVDDSRPAKEQHGLRRTLLQNAVDGVTKGFEKGLELVGVGYRVAVKGQTVELNVGYSNPVEFSLPDGISARVEGNKIFIAGIDKQLVGEIAAQIRRVRPPEPYKGKGIKFIDEQIRRKAGKSAKK